MNFGSGQDDRDVAMAFCANNAINLAEVPMQNMPEKEQKSVKGLVLGGGGDSTLDGQVGEESANFLVAEVCDGSAADKGLKTG